MPSVSWGLRPAAAEFAPRLRRDGPAMVAALYLFWAFVPLSAYFPVYSDAWLGLSTSGILIAVWAGAVVWAGPGAVRASTLRPSLGLILLFVLLRGDWVSAVCVVLLVTSLHRPAHLRWATWALAGVAVFLGIGAVVFWATRDVVPYTAMMRFHGPPRDPNAVGQIALLGLFAALSLVGDGRRWALLAVALGALTVLASESRAALVGLLIVLAACGWRSARARRFGGLGIGLWMILLSVMLIASQRIWWRLWRLLQGVDLGRRDEMARAAWRAFREHGLFGAGIGSFESYSGGLAPHGLLLETPAEGGLLRIMAGLFLVVFLVRDWRAGGGCLRGLPLLAVGLAALSPMDGRVLALSLCFCGLTVFHGQRKPMGT